MTITEKYIQMILPYLAIAEGSEVREKRIKGLIAYEFPCPFCSYLQTKDRHKRKRCSMLLPHKESFTYTFNCLRKGSNECESPRSFPNFLSMHNPSLFKQYQMERFHAGTTGKGHNCSTPKFI
jgi:hypothetical protein|tara:strand:+ start:721 stop:1089 length:369 start_codon:yes stop_codon:yes gene_type:complete